jgi:hypothetical protein
MGTTREEAVKTYIRAFCSGDAVTSQEAAEYLDEAVDLVSPPLHVRGAPGVLERITGHWPNMGMYSRADWSEPEDHGEVLRVFGILPEGLAVKDISLSFRFNGRGKIDHIEQVVTRGTPQAPSELRLTDEIKELVDNSLRDGCPIIVGYMGPDGQPQLSLRGSTQALNDTALAFWVRNPNGGIVKALAYNPRITLLYRDTPNRVNLLFQGSGHVETNESVRDLVFERMPQIEKDHDEQRKGACLVITLSSVIGATLNGPVRMARNEISSAN